MIEIKHRDTGDVLRTVDANTLREANLHRANLIGANLRGEDLSGANLYRTDLSRANLSGANLSEADLSEADLSGADLSGADLSGVNLSGAHLYRANLDGADLHKANLSRANLYMANLSGANLYVANLDGATILGDRLNRLLARATRLDGYEFFLFALEDGSAKIKAGCRWMSVADYRAHVAKEYPDTDKARETLRILDYFDVCSAALSAMLERGGHVGFRESGEAAL